MATKFPMEVRVSQELLHGRDNWSTEGVTKSVPNFSTFADLLGQKLGEFCDTFAKNIDPVNSKTADYMLDAIEMYVELTSKKEEIRRSPRRTRTSRAPSNSPSRRQPDLTFHLRRIGSRMPPGGSRVRCLRAQQGSFTGAANC